MAKNLKNNKDYINIFKSSLLEVANRLGIAVQEVTRDLYVRETVDNNLVRLNKDQINAMGGFRVSKNLFFPASANNIKDEKIDSKEELDNILKCLSNYIREFNKVPSFYEFEHFSGIKLSIVKKYFSSTIDLFKELCIREPKHTELVFNESSFTKEYLNKVQDKVKKCKRFVITTAVSGKKVDENFYNSLKNYASRNDAEILILPCEDVQSRKTVSQWDMDVRLRDCNVVFKDIYLNDNLYISDIKVSAKAIVPLTGLGRFTKGHGSMIIAGTKLFLEPIPKSGKDVPRVIMTTGAITACDYSNEQYMSKRTSKIAENDHILGAVIVEIVSNTIFHFRQVQASKSGSIVDLGVEYSPDGNVTLAEDITLILGDSHVGSHNLEVHEKLKDIINHIGVKDIVVHDLFDGESINHHDINKPVLQALKCINNTSSLELEGVRVKEYLEDLYDTIDGRILVVASNHNEFLDRYLVECRFVKDPENLYYSLDLCKALIEGKNPLRYMLEDKIGLRKDIDIEWLDRDDNVCKIHGIEISNHGDLGSGGSKGNLVGLEKCLGDAVIAHSHSPAIYRGVFRVGTLTNLRLDYNRGPSSWLHSVCVIYKGGLRQLINIIQDPDSGDYLWKY